MGNRVSPARCRGNLRNSLDEKIDLGRAEKTFLEIAELSATRSFYPDHLQVSQPANCNRLHDYVLTSSIFLEHNALVAVQFVPGCLELRLWKWSTFMGCRACVPTKVLLFSLVTPS